MMKGYILTIGCLWLMSFALLIPYEASILARIQGRSSSSTESWMTQPWTGNDAPYEQIETTIDQRIAGGGIVSALVQEYKDKAENQPEDPEAQFAWAYAVHEEAVIHHGILPPDSLHALIKVFPSNVYRCVRLRFLLAREMAPNNEHADLELVGLRLLERDSQDVIVHKNLVYDMDTRATVAKAITYAKSWVTQQPKSAAAHAVLASVYDSLFAYSRQTDFVSAQQVVSEYHKYLHLAPPHDPFRKDVVPLLQYYQAILKNHH